MYKKKNYTTSQSLQVIFAMQILIKKNLSLSVLENASISFRNYLPMFSTHRKDEGKIKG
jgi:hypothetical protein